MFNAAIKRMIPILRLHSCSSTVLLIRKFQTIEKINLRTKSRVILEDFSGKYNVDDTFKDFQL